MVRILLSLLLVAIPFQARATTLGASSGVGFLSTEWNELLKRNWKESKLPYAQIKADSGLLDRFLRRASEFNPASLKSRDEKLAFWINLYNACTLRVILDSYPLGGERKVDQIAIPVTGGEPISIWQKSFCSTGGKSYTLDQIEKEVLVGGLKEPLVHFAINCGALSCPNLRNEAYEPKRLQTQLKQQVMAFLADSSRNQFDGKAKKVRLSMIFGWYKEDFEKLSGGSLQGFLKKYVTKKVAYWIEDAAVEVEFLEYDWTLNDRV